MVRNMDWVEQSPVMATLRKVYWQRPVAHLTRPEFDLLVEAHPDKFLHSVDHLMDPVMQKASVLGTLFGKLILEDKI